MVSFLLGMVSDLLFGMLGTTRDHLTLYREALLIGACIAPTDPVVSSAVVQSVLAIKLVPSRVRNTIISGTSAPL